MTDIYVKHWRQSLVRLIFISAGNGFVPWSLTRYQIFTTSVISVPQTRTLPLYGVDAVSNTHEIFITLTWEQYPTGQFR